MVFSKLSSITSKKTIVQKKKEKKKENIDKYVLGGPKQYRKRASILK